KPFSKATNQGACFPPMIKSRRIVPVLVSAAFETEWVKEISAIAAPAIIAGDQRENCFCSNAILILRNILERTFDLAHLGAPGSDLFLYDLDQPEKTQGQNGQNKQHHQGKGGIQTVIRLQHEIA